MAFQDFFAAITLEDGSAHTAYNRGIATPSFSPIPTLGDTNLQISADYGGRVLTVDNSISNQLRFVYPTGGTWSSPLPVATGIGLAGVDGGQGGTQLELAVLGLGGPTTAGWSFGLPLLVIEGNRTTVDDFGDQTAKIALGDLNPADPPVALSLLYADRHDLGLLLATASGGLYILQADLRKGGSGFQDVKAKAGDPGNVVSVSVAYGDEGLNVCIVNDLGRIRHTILDAAGNWKPWGDVNAATRSTETFTQVAIACLSISGAPGIGSLHLAAITAAGDLLYTLRTDGLKPDPVWTPFTALKTKSGSPSGAVTSVALATPYIPG